MAIARRDFLWAGTAAAIGFAGANMVLSQEQPPAKQPGEPAEKKFRKAVKIGMVQHGQTLLEKFQLLKELGFDGVELNSPSDVTVEEAKRAIGETGLVVPGVVDSVHWRERLSDPDPQTRAKGLEALQAALRFCKDIGGSSVLLVPGQVKPDATFDQSWERSIAEIKKATPLAEELEIDILIENVWNDFLTDPNATARFIDACESSRVGAYFDVGNAVRYSPPQDWVPILGSRIKKLDIKDYKVQPAGGNPGAGFAAKLLEGDVDWPKVMAELGKIGYRGWGTAEIQGGGREWLTDVAARMDKIFAS
jgi:L-ribulose-5-phosphate 3-epimerase